MNDIEFSEYGSGVPAHIRNEKPGCPFVAVIPSITVETKDNIKGLADCFVHVASTNTTYYIDDKHRPMITWAGPVEVSDYDAATNPLGLRSQTCYDFNNNKAYYFNATGAYKTITLGA